jgi:hypothetical protein
VGGYRAEHLFTMRQSPAAYCSYQTFIDDCGRELRQLLEDFRSADAQDPVEPLTW